MKGILRFLVSILLVGIASGLVIASFKDAHFLRAAFSRASYYILSLLFLLWVGTGIQCWCHFKPDPRAFLRSYGAGILCAVILSTAIFISVKPAYRVLADETNLIAVSQSMTFEKRIDNITMGKQYYGNFNPFNREFPKRPLMFPFLVHLIHVLTGYRAANAFALNFILLAALFSLIFNGFKKQYGKLWGYAGMLLVAAQPVVSQTATSAGFDLLSAVMTLVCFMGLRAFLCNPSSEVLFRMLWVNLLVLANVRHESPLVFAIVIGVLFLFRYVKASFLSSSWIYSLTPLLCLPLVWEKIIRRGMKNVFEVPVGEKSFSVGHFLHHNFSFLKSLIRFDGFLPFANILAIAGVAGGLYLLVQRVRGGWAKDKASRHFILIAACSLAGVWVVLSSFHMGDLTHPTSSRYYVLFYVLFSSLALVAVHKTDFFKNHGQILLIGSAAIFLIYHPVSVENRFSNTQILGREYRVTLNYLKQQPDSNFLIIADRPGLYTVHQYGAVNFSHANKNAKAIIHELDRHLFREIFVVQEVEYEGLKVAKETVLDPAYRLETVYELQNKPDSFIRMSKVLAPAPV